MKTTPNTSKLKTVAEIALIYLFAACPALRAQSKVQPGIRSRTVPVLTINGLRFRDLNRDGKLEPFEDWRLSAMIARQT